MKATPENNRRYFRLPYPIGEGPRLVIDGVKYEVSELSEKGLRFYRPRTCTYTVGDALAGEISFHDGEKAALEGVVGRLNEAEVVLVNLEGITFSRMVAEQRNLIRKMTE